MTAIFPVPKNLIGIIVHHDAYWIDILAQEMQTGMRLHTRDNRNFALMRKPCGGYQPVTQPRRQVCY